jgi:tetratricopeptide (TPR) repeat protein
MGHLITQRRLVETLRRSEDPALAESLVALAEIEPVFEPGGGVFDANRRGAAPPPDAAPSAALQGRVLVRLAATQITAEKFEDANASLARAIAHLPEDHPGRIEAAALAVRSAVRQGARQRATEMVADLLRFLGDTPETHAERRAVFTVGMVVAEVMFESDDDRAEAIELFHDLLAGFADDDRFHDLAFLAHQALAAGELLQADERVFHHMRAIIAMTHAASGAADEIHARLALAGMLIEKGDPVSLDEAGRHLQIARDRALDGDLEDLHMLALIGQAGYLARRGRVHGAIDRCLEIARSAVDRQDVLRYVGAAALMSTIYELRGDLMSACRTLVEAEHGLGEPLGDPQARELIRPHLHGLAGRIGKERFLEILARIRAAHDIADDV